MNIKQLTLFALIILFHMTTVLALLFIQQRADARHEEMKDGVINLFENQKVIEKSCRGSWA